MTYNPLIRNADLRDSTGLSVIGRSVNTTGDPADIVASTDGYVLQRSGSTLIFGPVPAANSSSDGYAGKLAYWLDDSALTHDGYIDVSGGGVLSFSDNLFLGLYKPGETVLGSFVTPINYTVMESNAPMLISSNSNDGVIIGANIRGVTGDNLNPWAIEIFDGARAFVANRSAGSGSSLYSPTASMLASDSLSSFGVAGGIALASGDTDDGYGTAIESEENLAITALGDNLFLLSNNAAGESSVRIGSINGNGPLVASNWHDRYSDEAGHVSQMADFIYAVDGYAQLRMHSISAALNFSDLHPEYSFASAPGTGLFYSEAIDVVGIALNGFLEAYWSSDRFTLSRRLTVPQGTVLLPAVSFSATDTGIYGSGADFIGFSVDGVKRADITTTAFSATVPVLGANGSSTAPTYSFTSDPNTGMYSVLGDQLGFAAGGTARLTVSATEVYAIVPVRGNGGTTAAPTFSFTSDTNTGIANTIADYLTLVAGGVASMYVGSTLIQNTVPFTGPDGAVGAPAYSFNADSNTGIYTPSADVIGFASGGVKSGTISTVANYGRLDLDGTAGSLVELDYAGANRGGIYSDVGAFYLQSSTGVPTIFQVNGSEAGRITTDGYWGINKASPVAMLDIAGDYGTVGLKIQTNTAQWATFGATSPGYSYMTLLQGGSTSAAGYIGTGEGAISAVAGPTAQDIAIRADSGKFYIARGNVASAQFDTYGMVSMDPIVQLPPPITRINAKGAAGGTTVENQLISTPTENTPGGAKTSDDTATMLGIRYSTQAIASTSAGWNQIAYTVQTRHGFTFFTSFMPRSSLANVRYWAAVASANPDGSDAPSGTHLIGFRYSTAAGDSTWRCFTNDGTGTPTEATYVSGITVPTPALDVRQNLAIRVLNNGTRVEFWISIGLPGVGGSGTAVYKHVATATTDLPGVSTNIGYVVLVSTLANEQKQIAMSSAGYMTCG